MILKFRSGTKILDVWGYPHFVEKIHNMLWRPADAVAWFSFSSFLVFVPRHVETRSELVGGVRHPPILEAVVPRYP